MTGVGIVCEGILFSAVPIGDPMFWAEMSEIGSGSASGASLRFLFFLFFSLRVYWELQRELRIRIGLVFIITY